MNRKKRLCFVVAVGVSFILGSVISLWAGDEDIVNLLKQQNVITREQADKILDELKTKKQDEKKEMKKELTAEIKDELKKDADNGGFLPPALRGFKFGTWIIADWASTNQGLSSATNKFEVQRGYMILTKDVNDWLGVNLTADVFNTASDDASGTALEVRMKTVAVNINLFGTTTQLGLIPTPSESYDNAIWPYRVQGKNFLDGNNIERTADIGISIQGPIGGYMDDDYLKYAAKQFAGKWGGYFVELSNGSGYDSPEANGNKAVSGVIYVRPLPMIPILKGLQLAYVGTYGDSNSTFVKGAGDINADPHWRVNLVQASLQHEMFTLMYQYYWGEGTFDSTNEDNSHGYQVEGFVRVPMVEKLRVFAKCTHFNADTTQVNDDYMAYTGGLSYDVTKEFMPYVAYTRKLNGNAYVTGEPNSDMYQIGFQFKL